MKFMRNLRIWDRFNVQYVTSNFKNILWKTKKIVIKGLNLKTAAEKFMCKLWFDSKI